MLNSSFTLQCNERFQAVSPASQSRSMSQTWGHTAGRRRGTRWCQSCRSTWKAMVWAQCNGFLHYFGKWKNYHLKNAWGDVEAVALVADDNIGFIRPVKLLISTGSCFLQCSSTSNSLFYMNHIKRYPSKRLLVNFWDSSDRTTLIHLNRKTM